MPTFLWKEIVFGPIHSRRVGNSLGINLLPTGCKVCSFDCVYCECGSRKAVDVKAAGYSSLPSTSEVKEAVAGRFKALASDGVAVDSISFTGNGEPTLHPGFAEIIDCVVEARDTFFPQAVISVFSNATMARKPEIAAALSKIDNPILKLDAGTEDLAWKMNRPCSTYSVEDTIDVLRGLDFKFIIQTMFVCGDVVDNTTSDALDAWYSAVRSVNPGKIMIYSIDRDTPVAGLERVSAERLAEIAAPLLEDGFNIQINA